jgi:hypothetical protein
LKPLSRRILRSAAAAFLAAFFLNLLLALVFWFHCHTTNRFASNPVAPVYNERDDGWRLYWPSSAPTRAQCRRHFAQTLGMQVIQYVDDDPRHATASARWHPVAQQCLFGFPIPCLGYAIEYIPSGYQLHNGIYINSRIGPLPTGIVWSALLLNTLVFGIPLFALTQVTTVIRWRRRRAGRCPNCNYDRTGLAPTLPCPECGGRPTHDPSSAP